MADGGDVSVEGVLSFSAGAAIDGKNDTAEIGREIACKEHGSVGDVVRDPKAPSGLFRAEAPFD